MNDYEIDVREVARIAIIVFCLYHLSRMYMRLYAMNDMMAKALNSASEYLFKMQAEIDALKNPVATPEKTNDTVD